MLNIFKLFKVSKKVECIKENISEMKVIVEDMQEDIDSIKYHIDEIQKNVDEMKDNIVEMKADNKIIMSLSQEMLQLIEQLQKKEEDKNFEKNADYKQSKIINYNRK